MAIDKFVIWLFGQENKEKKQTPFSLDQTAERIEGKRKVQEKQLRTIYHEYPHKVKKNIGQLLES